MTSLQARTRTGELALISASDVSTLENRLRGTLLRPTDEPYEQARHIWNGMIDKHPALIARCVNAEDVGVCIDFVREHGIPVSVRGGGHNVAGHAMCEGGLVIDLGAMNTVRVEQDRRLAHIAGGALLGDVDTAADSHGTATPSGVVAATGYAGLSLHGGMGWQTRKYGLAADNVVGVEIVTADGKRVHANQDEAPELWWAVRGGGGNFGVVTEFTARLHPVPRQVQFSTVIYSLDDAPSVLAYLRDFMAEAPDSVSALASLWTGPEERSVPAAHRGRPVLFLLVAYMGAAEEAESVVRPLRMIRTPVWDLTRRMPWLDLQNYFRDEYPDGRRYYWKSMMSPGLSGTMIDTLAAQLLARPSPLSSIDIWYLGGAYGRVGATDTAFGARDRPFVINYESGWERSEDDQANVTWARESLATMQELSQARPRTYLNFAGLGEQPDTLVRDSYGGTYERLQRVKQEYDPENVFSSTFNVKPG
jgi:FAD/FMN-containing dehydrogenase